jgi:hypothetical protein
MEDPMTKPKKKTDATTNLARELLGAPLANVFERTFHRVELAEEEIDAAKRRHPNDAERIHRAFLILCPSDPLHAYGDELYRAHCRELLERVRLGGDTRPATSAEVVACLSAASLQVPPGRPATFLYWQLFGALFPDQAEKLRAEIGPVAADSHDKSVADDLARKLRRKLTVPTRAIEVDRPASQLAS